eukprot:3340215-Prymnesium_polylepis.1
MVCLARGAPHRALVQSMLEHKPERLLVLARMHEVLHQLQLQRWLRDCPADGGAATDPRSNAHGVGKAKVTRAAGWNRRGSPTEEGRDGVRLVGRGDLLHQRHAVERPQQAVLDGQQRRLRRVTRSEELLRDRQRRGRGAVGGVGIGELAEHLRVAGREHRRALPIAPRRHQLELHRRLQQQRAVGVRAGARPWRLGLRGGRLGRRRRSGGRYCGGGGNRARQERLARVEHERVRVRLLLELLRQRLAQDGIGVLERAVLADKVEERRHAGSVVRCHVRSVAGKSRRAGQAARAVLRTERRIVNAPAVRHLSDDMWDGRWPMLSPKAVS